MTNSRQPMSSRPTTAPSKPSGQQPPGGRRRGRRPRGSGARAEILEAARHEFAALGYPNTSLRGIAAGAGVDPHLIAHYFGSKRELFLAVAAQPPFEPEVVVDQLYSAGQPGLGHRLAEFVLSLSRTPASQETFTALVRAAATEKQAAALLHETVYRHVLLPLLVRLGNDHPELRASLIASQILGLNMATHIIGLSPLAGAPTDLRTASLAPVFEHYLSGALSPR